MRESVKVTAFSVDQCGYYAHGPRRALVHQFCDINQTLTQLNQWVKGVGPVELALTQTYSQPPNSDLLPAYVYDIVESSGEWLLVLWNQTPSTDKAVASVMPNAVVGSAAVIANEIAEGSVPGFPSYFWIQPARSRIFGIRFEYTVAGHQQLQTYLQSFLTRSVAHAICAPSPQEFCSAFQADIEIIGYRHHSSDPLRQDVFPRFKSGPIKNVGDIHFIVAHWAKIRKILNRTTLDLHRPEDLALWQRLWRSLHGTPAAATSNPVRIAYEINTPITRSQVEELIREYESSDSTWDDVGFQFEGESSPRWIGKAYARGDFELDVERNNPSVVSATSLLAALKANRQMIEQLVVST